MGDEFEGADYWEEENSKLQLAASIDMAEREACISCVPMQENVPVCPSVSVVSPAT